MNINIIKTRFYIEGFVILNLMIIKLIASIFGQI
jgi:hypothetical protein